jgi:hypothetical protein
MIRGVDEVIYGHRKWGESFLVMVHQFVDCWIRINRRSRIFRMILVHGHQPNRQIVNPRLKARGTQLANNVGKMDWNVQLPQQALIMLKIRQITHIFLLKSRFSVRESWYFMVQQIVYILIVCSKSLNLKFCDCWIISADVILKQQKSGQLLYEETSQTQGKNFKSLYPSNNNATCSSIASRNSGYIRNHIISCWNPFHKSGFIVNIA